ncbi:ATP-binding cassette domain-containing protein [Arthrobacter sp. P2b]|uniref:ATP-binding cassette domain-containing protein n=1 Tax=Arthrobacter sp. P2b TaxID=1938741 RepID=UPI0009C7619E|nr:ATP-binding cassette domain-containing protein [Arthrobacter sp. P2b]SLK16956.1 ribose transport system ATP-binding protein [Arthrobacter sp. P2b]
MNITVSGSHARPDQLNDHDVDREAGLAMRGVTKQYPGVTALEDVTFSAIPGTIHALVGGNGAGKSTLMGVAAGSVTPDSGSVWIGGSELDSADPDHARQLGLAIVRQRPALLPDLTVAENLLLGQPEPIPVRKANTWARGILAAWDSELRVDPKMRAAELAPDKRFIVEIANAVARNPKVLVLDEPTEHLRAGDVARLFEQIRRLAEAGTAVIYISHRIHEVREIAERVTVLRDGKIQGTFDAEDLTEGSIVSLIAGRPIDAIFPSKSANQHDKTVLDVVGLNGDRFHDVNLKVRQGEIVGLAGIDDNGQREFLRALAGLESSKGKILLDDGSAASGGVRGSVRSGIVYLPVDRQDEGIIPGYSVLENLTMRSRRRYSWHGIINAAKQRDQATRSAASLAVATPSLETPVGSLSGGNQQKVVISSILASEPRVLLADEPTQGVDVQTRSEIYRQLRQVSESGTAVVVLSSDALELAGLCDRVLVFSRGRVIAEHDGDAVTEPNIAESIVTSTTERRENQHQGGRLLHWFAGYQAPLVMVAIGIVLLTVIATLADSRYLSAFNVATVLALTATLALATYGQQMVMLVGGIDLSIAPLMGLIVVTESFYLVEGISAGNQLLGWALLVIIGAAVGVVNWALIDVVKLTPVIATLATYMAIQGISLILRPTPGGYISSSVLNPLVTRFGILPLIFLGAVLLAVALEIVLLRSRLGIRLRAVGSNEAVAEVLGISGHRFRFLAYVGGSLMGALAAIPLMTQIGSGDPSAGLSYLLPIVAAAVVGGASIFGGRGSFIGALLGSLLLTQISSVAGFLGMDSSWNNYLLGAVLIVAVAAYSASRAKVAAK